MSAGKTRELRQERNAGTMEKRRGTEIDMTFHLLLLVPNVPSLRDLRASMKIYF